MAEVAPMPGSALKHNAFASCPCCVGPAPKLRTAEKRAWRAEVNDEIERGED